MDWLQVVSLILGNTALILPLWLWSRSESRSDMRHMDAKLEAALQMMNGNVQAIQAEIKDFHGRLCAIEERNRK
jgi:cell division protein FtsB